MPPKNLGNKNKPIQEIERKRAALLKRLAKIGPVLQGTITRRSVVREDPQAPGTQKEYGPYNQWTWKREGKTVTVNLSGDQLKPYQRAIDENRKLEELLRQLRETSLQLLEATTEGVKKRTKRKDASEDEPSKDA